VPTVRCFLVSCTQSPCGLHKAHLDLLTQAYSYRHHPEPSCALLTDLSTWQVELLPQLGAAEPPSTRERQPLLWYVLLVLAIGCMQRTGCCTAVDPIVSCSAGHDCHCGCFWRSSVWVSKKIIQLDVIIIAPEACCIWCASLASQLPTLPICAQTCQADPEALCSAAVLLRSVTTMVSLEV
jgi:hypothetical protein